MEKSSAYQSGESEAYNDYMNCSWSPRSKIPYYIHVSEAEELEFWRGYNAMWNKMDAADRGYNQHDMSGDVNSPDWNYYHND